VSEPHCVKGSTIPNDDGHSSSTLQVVWRLCLLDSSFSTSRAATVRGAGADLNDRAHDETMATGPATMATAPTTIHWYSWMETKLIAYSRVGGMNCTSSVGASQPQKRCHGGYEMIEADTIPMYKTHRIMDIMAVVYLLRRLWSSRIAIGLLQTTPLFDESCLAEQHGRTKS
jgi:hypothetical protein